MRKRIITFLSILLFPLLLVIGFSSWIIVGEGSATVGKTPITGAGVAYIGSDKSKLYTSIEGALYKAKAGEVVNVLLDADAPNKVISRDCTVKAGVTLNIDFDDDGVAQKENSSGIVAATVTGSTLSLKNSITVKKGVTINNYGTIVIGGLLSSSSTGYGIGYTSNTYAKLVLEEGATINNYTNSIFQCCGFVEEFTLNNSSKVNIFNGATLKIPFIIMDFRGGSTSYALYKNFSKKYSSPFNQFDLRNIQCKYEIFYGGYMFGYANVSINNEVQASLIKVVGPDDNYFVSLTPKDNNGSTVSDKEKNSVSIQYNKKTQIIDFIFKGGASINKIELTIKVLFSVTLSTQQVYLPFGWRTNIKLTKYEGQTSEAYFYAKDQKIKLMTGGVFEVGEGCTFISTNMNVYSFYRDKTNAYSSANIGGNAYPNKEPALFIVKGTYINSGTFGGTLIKGPSASVSIGSTGLTTYEPFIQSDSNVSTSIDSWLTVTEEYTEKTIEEYNNLNRVVFGIVNVDNYSTATYSISGGIIQSLGNATVNKNYFVSPDTKFTPNIATNITKATYTNGTSTHSNYVKSKELTSKGKSDTFAMFLSKENIGDIKVQSITISGGNEVKVGETLKLTATINTNAYTKSVKWEVVDGYESYASINSTTGVVTGKEIGLCKVKAISDDGDNVSSNEYEINVIDPNTIIPASEELTTITADFNSGEGEAITNKKITLSIQPSNASEYTITWACDKGDTYHTVASDSKSITINIPKNETKDNTTYYKFTATVTNKDGSSFVETCKVGSVGSVGEDSGCLLPGTMITMADGTKKPVEQIQPGDMLKVFNHYTGEYDVSPVVFNDSEPKQDVKVINLEFSNGSNIGVVYEHGFFDLDLMKYVYIDEYNYNDYIGHRFYSDGNNIVTLNRAYITTQYTEVYSPVTAYHLNYFTEDILSMPGGIEGLFNIFEYDDDLKYNEELMKQDIEKYGLYTYDDFKYYCSYEFYQAFPAEYLKVAVGKGYITFDEIIYLINRYKNKV